jgi:UTP:GlnB (protein PII) uridylyltransferase
VNAQASPDADHLQRLINEALRRPLSSHGLEDATVEFDDAASPWHTVCTARASDRLGLLQALTTAFAAADTNVHAARVLRSGTTVVGIFELTDSKSRKLGPATQEAIRSFLSAGVMERPSRWPFISRRSLRARPVAAPAS